MYWDYNRIDFAGANTVSGANTTVLQPGGPIDVKRVVAVVTTATTVAPAVISFGVRDADGGNSVTMGSFAIPVSAADAVIQAEVADQGAGNTSTGADGSAVNGEPWGIIQVNPGQEFFLTSDAGATAGAVDFYVEYIVQGFSGERVAAAVEAAVTRVA